MKFKYGDSVHVKDKFFGDNIKGRVQDYKIINEGTQGEDIRYKILFLRGSEQRWFEASQLKIVKGGTE